MITLSIGVFFWLSIGYLTLKYKLKFSPYIDIAFLTVVIIFMSGINMTAMSNCGSPEIAILYTILPWMGIFLPMLVMLYYFPNWKAPFSNTIGYFIVSFDKNNINTLVSLLKDKTSMVDVLKAPWVLLNQYTSDMFTIPPPETEIAADPISTDPVVLEKQTVGESSHMRGGASNMYLDVLNLADTKNIAHLKDILLLKEIVSLWVWYILAAFITISTSYTLIINNSCTKEKKGNKKENEK